MTTKRMAAGASARDAVDISSIGPNFGLAVRLLDLRLMKRASEAFGDLSLTPATATALLAIDANPGVRHGELADALRIQRPNLTKMLNQLVDEGLLRRGESAGDRRLVTFALTPRGARAAESVRNTMATLDARAISGLSEAEQATLLALIVKLTRALDEANAPDAALT
jgi:DNA-binding MarR family transcriptional regulator